MKTSLTKQISLLAAFLLLALHPAFAQVTLTGTNYFEDFDDLANGLPANWSIYKGDISPTSLGDLAPPFTNSATSWSATTGAFANYASTTDGNGTTFTGTESTAIQKAAVNRALGVRETAAFGDGSGSSLGVAMAVEIHDTIGLGNFVLDVDCLNLSPQGRTMLWAIEYGFGDTPNSFVQVTNFLVLSTTSGGVFGAMHKTITFSNVLDNQPGPVWIRFVTDTNTISGSGSRPTFGIDNFNLQYSAVAVTVNPVVITSQPVSSTNGAGSSVTFTVGESGTSPIMNQWFQVKDGVTNQLFDGGSPSGDGAQISGSSGPSLTISGLLGYESATYFAVAGNSLTTATNSASATLVVVDPFISAQPSDNTNLTGDLDEFFATMIGTSPFELTWYHGTNVILDVVTNSFLNTNSIPIFVTNSAANSGNYYVVVSNMFGVTTSLVATATVPVTPSTVITRWDFDDTGDYTPTAPLAAVGTGTGSTVGGPTITNYTFANGSFADPNLGTGNFAWELENYPPQGTSNKMVGFQFNTSTVGYQDIFLAWQERHSATASSYMRLQYSTNGTDFIDGDVIRQTLVQYNYASSDLSSKPGVANNPNFAFRIVAEFESTAIGTTNNNYVATTSTSTYGPGTGGGTVRIDMMTVLGDAAGSVPIPLAIQSSGTNIVLSWSDSAFQLESAPAATGPWSAPLSVTSPYTNATTGTQQYFRLVK